MSELKTCAHCGCEAGFEHGVLHVWVSCTKCMTSSAMYLTEAEAIEAWNTRHERTCDGCKHGFPICHDPCWECSRYYSDLYEPKEDTDAD